MTIDFQTWMRAVWTSIMEPSDSARKVINMDVPRDALWTALALVAVLNVILVVLLQLISPIPVAFEDRAIAFSPFGFTVIMGTFLVLFVFGTFYAGKMLGGVGTLTASLAIVVWFQSVSLTLEAIQLVLMLISPAIASIFGLLSFGALIWCFLNFVNILHAFNNLGKAFVAILLAFVGTAIIAGIVATILGVVPTEGLA
ncbi:Yip1-like protein [Yoonia maricola]|uniref:Yip1-like protein n=1 Tax=Yoonia maricola TaxID=420999 RepID=A0A2M8WM51_9RHOB|nr:YIP1 family protein [Yoonia maricola]PJI92005.1 Yip1-like protein [Yoonia maricola]